MSATPRPHQPVGDPVHAAPQPAAVAVFLLEHPPAARLDGAHEPRLEIFREFGLVDDDVGLARQQQAEGIEIGRAHAGDAVDDGHLGVQVAGHVLVDLDAARQQLLVQGARGVVLHAVVRLALQQHAHAHAARDRLQQGLAEGSAGEEIGVGDEDLAAGVADAVQVGLLEGLAVAQVVAQHQGGALAAGRRAVGRARGLEEPQPAPVAQLARAAPQPAQFNRTHIRSCM